MTHKIGHYIERIDQVNSTNNFASKLLLTNRPPEGTVIVTGNQVDGRGQGKNKWESEPYKNLTISIILYPEFLEVTRQFEMSKAISLAVADFLSEITGDVSIKWPNDIYIGKGKAAGILMEYTIVKGKISSCIVGIGLNINQQTFSSTIPKAVSLSQVTGKTYDLEDCLIKLLEKINVRYLQLAGNELESIDYEYKQLLYQRDTWSWYTAKGEDFEGKITGVDKNGLLKIQTRHHTVLSFDFKEVSFKT